MSLHDLRHALRQLSRMPGFVLTTIVTLVLGIGANAAIFSVVNGVLRHPAGVDNPERVAVMKVRYTQFSLDIPWVSVPDLLDAAALKDQVEAASLALDTSFNIVHDGTVEHLPAERVSVPWFQVFGARPILGRTFTPQEDQPGAAPVAVLSYGLWQRAFGGRRDVLGQTITLDQKPYQVIGVMRSDFDWPRGKQLWVPIALPPQASVARERFNENYYAYLRLRAGASIAQLNAGLAQKMQLEILREGKDPYGTSSGWSMYATPLTQFAAGPLRKPLNVLFAVVALILLIASANVAGLFLARTSARTREFAIRTVLGANAMAILRPSLIETMLLAGVATLIGIASGPILGRLLLWLIPHNLAEGYSVNIDPALLAFTAAAGLFTALVAGVGPALKLLRQYPSLKLYDGGRSATASIEKQRLRSAFVIAEVAIAFLLLTGTGLFLVSLRQLQRVDPGFNPKGVLAASVYYSGDELKRQQPRQAAFIDAVVDQLSHQPGVTAAAAVEPLPFDPEEGGSSSFGIIGRPSAPNDPGPHSQLAYASPGYLKLMQIPLVAGRWIGPEDRSNTEPVAVIDARLAKRYWPNQNPVGQHITGGLGKQPALIIGVAGTIRLSSLEEDSSDGMRYYASAQAQDALTNFLIRTNGDPNSWVPAMQRAVASADSAQAAYDIQTLESLVSASLAGRRLIVDMLAAFAALALLLAIVGIYGLISYITIQRTGEVGIRMALGAQRIDILSLVLSSVFTWIVAGLSIGAVLSFVTVAVLRHAFTAFGAGILPSLGAAIVALFFVGAIAAWVPARRATSIQPIEALRNE
jgi:predicted permease